MSKLSPLVQGLLLFFVFFAVNAGDPECWKGGPTEEQCCDFVQGPRGDTKCWDDHFTFERCCDAEVFDDGPFPITRPGFASTIAVELRVETTSVPKLNLPGGGTMPQSGIGMCCRPTASGDAARQAVLDFLIMGGRLVDTATLYKNHAEVGEGLRQAVAAGVPRAEIFLTTKINPPNFGFEATSTWVKRTLRELGVEYIDLVLLHTPRVAVGDRDCGTRLQCRQETWLALQRARRNGHIKHLGVSNFGVRQLTEFMALGEPVEVNQIEYHPWVTEKYQETAAFCHQNGIFITSYGSMGSRTHAKELTSESILQRIGRSYGKTAGQVLLRWAIQHNVTVIPGTSNPKHMAENLNIFDFELSPQEMAMFDNIPPDQQMVHFGMTPDTE